MSMERSRGYLPKEGVEAMMFEFLALFLAYVCIGTAIAFASRRFGIASTREMFVAGYRLSGFLAAMTYAATTYSAFMMVGLVGLAYVFGVVALGFELTYFVATLGILATVGVALWRLAKVRGWVSPSEMIGDLYGSTKLSIFVALTYLIALVPYLAAQIKGMGEVFRGIGMGYELGVALGTAIAFLWIALAGVWSVATTDAFQGVWMLGAATCLALWLSLCLAPSMGTDVGSALMRLANASNGNLLSCRWPPHVFLGYAIPWIFFALTNPQVVQRLYMPRDAAAYRRMVVLFAFFGILYTVLTTFIGMVFRGLAMGSNIESELLTNRDAVTPTILSMAPPLLASFVYVSIVAAACSTANSIALSVASCIVRDLYEKRRGSTDPGKVRVLTLAIVGILLIVASIVAALRVSYVVELSVLSSAILIPLAPVTLAGLFLEPRRWGWVAQMASIAVGYLAIPLAFIEGVRSVFVSTILGLPPTMWILIASTILSLSGCRPRKRAYREYVL